MAQIDGDNNCDTVRTESSRTRLPYAISGLERCEIASGETTHSGISFMVSVPAGMSGTEIVLTNGQLKQLLDFGQWKRNSAPEQETTK